MAIDLKTLEESKSILIENSDRFVDYFYDRLLEKAPDLAHIFRNTDLADQKAKLWEGMVQILDLIEEPADLKNYLNDLGLRHVCYEVQPQHYVLVREILLEAIEHVHGDQWSERFVGTWQAAVSLITHEMIAGADQLAGKSGGAIRADKGAA